MTIDYGALIIAETAAFADAASRDLDAPIAACPGWDMAKLTKHLGITLRFGLANVLAGDPDTPIDGRAMDLGLPADRADWPEWLRQTGVDVADALVGIDPAAPAWTFTPDRTVVFWPRRLAFEATVHCVDAQRAVGIQPAIDEEIGFEGVEEFLEFVEDLGVTVTGNGEEIVFYADGTAPRRYAYLLTPDGFAHPDAVDPGPEGVTVRGPAAALFLALWNRGDEAIEVEGDPAVWAKFRTEARI